MESYKSWQNLVLEQIKNLRHNAQCLAVFLAPTRHLTETICEYRMADSEDNSIYYIPQVPCKHGHKLRYKKINKCVECSHIWMAKTYEKVKSKRPLPKYFRSDYSKNPTQFDGPFYNAVCIPLTKGQHCIIDSDDYDLLHQYFWYLAGGKVSINKQYASASLHEGKHTTWPMHRFIKKPGNGLFVDHINRNTLDNRKSNLRICTKLENSRNTSNIKSKSQYKGVSPSMSPRQINLTYSSRIRINGVLIHLGNYKSEVEAAKAYDNAAIKHFGEFAAINFPESNKQ